MYDLYSYVDARTQKPSPLLAANVWAVIDKHRERLNSVIIYERDNSFNYFGFKVLCFTVAQSNLRLYIYIWYVYLHTHTKMPPSYILFPPPSPLYFLASKWCIYRPLSDLTFSRSTAKVPESIDPVPFLLQHILAAFSLISTHPHNLIQSLQWQSAHSTCLCG